VFEPVHPIEGSTPCGSPPPGRGHLGQAGPMVVRIYRALLVLALGVTVGLVAVTTVRQEPHPRAGVSTTDRGPARPDDALAVLHAWDVRRAEAWATGDPGALGRLYTERSRAGAADVALLRRYAARGLVVRDLRMQVLRTRVLVARPRLLELEVTDRLAGATAVRVGDPGAARRLPADAASTRVLVLRRPADRWVLARVSAAPGR
jgi:hypothetical protein